MARAFSTWPASEIRAASVSPDLSSAGVRVSDTVSTAMPTGMKGRLSSIRFMSRSGNGFGCFEIPVGSGFPQLRGGPAACAFRSENSEAGGAGTGHPGEDRALRADEGGYLPDLRGRKSVVEGTSG